MEVETLSSLIDPKKLILKITILDHKTGDKMTNLFELEVLIDIQQRHFLEIKEDRWLSKVKANYDMSIFRDFSFRLIKIFKGKNENHI